MNIMSCMGVTLNAQLPMIPLNLQLMAQGGDLVNATGNYVNAYTGATTPFSGADSMSAGMKTYYDTELLENARPKLVYAQLGKKFTLPRNHGKTIEWRKWNTLPALGKLTEGVIPTGKKFGQTSLTVEISQYGDYVAITDMLDMHHVDNVILGATEELGSAAGKTYDQLVRDVIKSNTNVLYADAYNAGAYVSTPASRAALQTAAGTNQCYFTADMVAKAVRTLRMVDAPYYEGNKYVAVVHPAVTYDLRNDKAWIEAHKYASTREIFEGEIGELHGVRFIESTIAPVHIESSKPDLYLTMIFGKDAFGVVDPEGAGMETIIKDRKQVGGPLEQFSTVGAKLAMATKVLYPERMVTVESAASYKR